jgi:hypothetical protein
MKLITTTVAPHRLQAITDGLAAWGVTDYDVVSTVHADGGVRMSLTVPDTDAADVLRIVVVDGGLGAGASVFLSDCLS